MTMKITTYAEDIIASLYKRRGLYKSLMVGDSSFDVRYIGEDGRVEVKDYEVYDVLNTPLPLFKRIRRVNLDDDGVMYYSCQCFETTGMFCSHQDSVAFVVSDDMGID